LITFKNYKMNDYMKFKLKTNLIQGDGVLLKINEFIREFNFKKICFFYDKNLYDNNGYVQEVVKTFSKDRNFTFFEFDYPFEPSYDYLDNNKSFFGNGKTKKFDCIIAVGGGSCIDSAKGFATLATNSGPAINFRGFPKDLNASIPVIAAPTTAGTGTELAYNAVFIDTKEGKKLGINTENNYPVMAILDPSLVVESPKNVIKSSGLDAMVHTLESFVSLKSNYLTRIFSKQAFRLIINNLEAFYNDSGNINLASNMQLGAYLAMAALSNSSAGPSGALSYLIGTRYKINHGIAGAVFIGKVSRYNHKNGYYDYGELLNDQQYDKNGLEGKNISEEVVSKIENLLDALDIPSSLTGVGINKDDFDELIDFADSNYRGAFDLNPVSFSKEQIGKILIN